MDISFISKDCTPPVGRVVGSGGRIFPMDEEPQEKLLARIALFRQENKLACICCTDQKFFFNKAAYEIRERIAKECNIPVENILLAASHTHSVPDLLPTIGIPAEDQIEFSFVSEYAGWLVEAITEAKKNFIPLQHWELGSAATECWGICRRPIFRMKNDTIQAATQAARDFGDLVGLDGKDENILSAFAAYGSQGLVGGFVNYACHPTTMYGSKFYSPDFPGVFYERVDSETPGVFLYANGPNGNISPSGGGPEFCHKMGKSLAIATLDAIEQAEQYQPGKLRILEDRFSIPRRKPTSRQLEYAREFLNKEPDDEEIANFTSKMYGVEYHFHNNSLGISQNLCRQLFSLNEEIESGIDSEEVIIQVIAVSKDIAFIGVSAELFNQFTSAIQKQSPFKYNCIIQLANGWNGYIPPTESYKLGGYECCLSLINRLVPEAFDTIVDQTVKALNSIFSEK